jgi:flagellar protein FliL
VNANRRGNTQASRIGRKYVLYYKVLDSRDSRGQALEKSIFALRPAIAADQAIVNDLVTLTSEGVFPHHNLCVHMMANPKQSPEPAAGASPEKKSRKLLLIFAIAMILVAGGGGFYFMRSKTSGSKAEVKKSAVFLDLPDMTINLAQTPGLERQSFLKLKVVLEVVDQKTLTELQPVIPRLLDNFQVFLRELKATDLEGSTGLYRLKEELVRRTNMAVHPARVEAILFKELLVQ